MNVHVVSPGLDENLRRSFEKSAEESSARCPVSYAIPKKEVHEIRIPANPSGRRPLSVAYGHKLRWEHGLDQLDRLPNIFYNLHVDPALKSCIDYKPELMEPPFWGALFGPTMVSSFLRRLHTPEPPRYEKDKWLCPNDLIRRQFRPIIGKTADDTEVAGIVMHTLKRVACRYINIADAIYNMEGQEKAVMRRGIARLRNRYSLRRLDISGC